MLHDAVIRERYNSRTGPDFYVHGIAGLSYTAPSPLRTRRYHQYPTVQKKEVKPHPVPGTDIPYLAQYVVHKSPHRSNHPIIITVDYTPTPSSDQLNII